MVVNGRSAVAGPGCRVDETLAAGFPEGADEPRVIAMPSLLRLLMVVGLLGGFAYGAMFALANFVTPKQREMSITIPANKLTKPN
jgi:hypothetical protein